MDVEKIRELIDLMTENDLTEIKIIDGDTRLLLKRGGQTVALPAAPPLVLAPVAPAAPTVDVPAAPADEDDGLVAIASPMVGTFYGSAGPDVDPFVREGDHVSADTVVCIIEAMKVMNEIKAEVSGTIEKIVAVNSEPVEFGQTMFMVRAD